MGMGGRAILRVDIGFYIYIYLKNEQFYHYIYILQTDYVMDPTRVLR